MGDTSTYPSAEVGLMQRIKRLAGPVLDGFAPLTSAPESFWAALTANESGRYLIHDLSVPASFEPKIYHYFQDALHGISLSYAGVKQVELEVMSDAEIRALSSGHGLTQVMGYQAHAQGHPVADLDDPEKHYPIAAGVLVGFLHHFGLDPRADFTEMATCWNTGNPNGQTTDPDYVSNLLLRKAIWEALA